MKAVGYTAQRPISDPAYLEDLTLPDPTPGPHDLLVRVHAVAVNPRDLKSHATMKASAEKPGVLGYDASGVVAAVGDAVTLFRPGDAVFYAGVVNRPGTNAELHCVDERIVGRKPRSLDDAAAAALPLTSLTAYEMLFDRLAVGREEEDAAVLIVGGAGGVPSIAIQLARVLTRLTVIATASRPESEAWVRRMGAHHVVDHTRPLAAQVAKLAAPPARYVFSTHTDAASWAEAAQLIAPQGRYGLIDDPEPLDLRLFKSKSCSIHWEGMFTRGVFATPDMQRQHDILNEIADLVDAGRLQPTGTELIGTINAGNLHRAHQALAEGRTIGKLVLAGF